MMGWSILINIISVILVYFYAPQDKSGLPILIVQAPVFWIFNAIALITASGRLADALYDPFIAHISDNSKNPKGRRIPLMKLAVLPSIIFCFLIFFPLRQQESSYNVLWLVAMLIGFYISSTTYIIPYNALLPELAPTSKDKLQLATWQSVGYVFGIGISSNAFNLADALQGAFTIEMRISALQAAVAVLTCFAAVFMLIPVLAIDERKYCTAIPNAVPIRSALRQTLRNRNFLFFVVADFSYFISVTIIPSGLLYFVTVLLGLDESIGNKLMITMVLVSFIFYPVVNLLARKAGKKIIVIGSLVLLALVFLGIFFLGKIPVNPELQIYLLVGLAAIPVASLNILPNAILAEVIEKDSEETKENKEAVYFAVRYFFVKIAQTVGIALFSVFLLYGKDKDNDFGIRLNGLLGFGLCVIAAIIFSWFREKVSRDDATNVKKK